MIGAKKIAALITPPAPVWEPIGETPLVSSEFNFLKNFSRYSFVRIFLIGITTGTDDTQVRIQFYVAGTVVTTAYRYGVITTNSATGNGNVFNQTGTYIALLDDTAGLALGNASTESFSGIVTIANPSDPVLWTYCTIEGATIIPSGAVCNVRGSGILENAGAVDGIKVLGSSSLTGGKFVAYGML